MHQGMRATRKVVPLSVGKTSIRMTNQYELNYKIKYFVDLNTLSPVSSTSLLHIPALCKILRGRKFNLHILD